MRTYTLEYNYTEFGIAEVIANTEQEAREKLESMLDQDGTDNKSDDIILETSEKEWNVI